MAKFIVTIDGPAGSGKSTIAKLLAERAGFIHINSGALYRAVAYIFGKDVSRESLNGIDLRVKCNKKGFKIFYNGVDITDKLQSERVGKIASDIARKGFVRDFVNEMVRDIPKEGRFVIDGRDCGSVIFPEADVKIFLTASPKERARRRAREINDDVDKVLREIEKRDEQDMNRDIAPLVKPEDALLIDTTGLSIEEVYGRVVDIVRRVYDNRNS